MNKPAMIKAMKVSISEVLEQMFFLPIDMVDAEKENTTTNLNDQQTIMVSVGFEGPPTGTFMLNIPADLAATVTADFLGTVPEELTVEQIAGTVKEMINMLAGNSLSAYDPESPINLKIPELHTAQNDSGATKGNKGKIDIDIEIETLDSRMTLQMTMQQT